jgi:hypothetical protein
MLWPLLTVAAAAFACSVPLGGTRSLVAAGVLLVCAYLTNRLEDRP